MPEVAEHSVLTVADVSLDTLESLLARYGLELFVEDDGAPVTGSFWGDPEAGIIGKTVYVREDTPIHSLLHESCHVICMTAERRGKLDRDAGGSHLEEAAVCYLQVVLSDRIDRVGRQRIMRDMDAWGYSFRLGSAREWFLRDADDARKFLVNHGLLTGAGHPTYVLRP